MARMSLLAIVGMLVATSAAPAGDRLGMIEATVNRTVHVTVTDAKGLPVTDLTPADLTVKEGGKEREVVKVEPAQARMRLALAFEERLVAEGSVRFGMFEFVKRVAKVSDVSLISIGLVNRTIVDYTPDANSILDAINKLTLNAGRDSNVAEGVLEIANKFIAAKAERPVLVVVALSGDQVGVDPRTVLDKLGESGATMHSVLLATGRNVSSSAGSMGDESGREQVLGDGPKQSGGRRFDVTASTGIPKALEQVAGDLLSQYAITYVLPDGVKPNKRFSVSTKKRGITLRAPSTIPDR